MLRRVLQLVLAMTCVVVATTPAHGAAERIAYLDQRQLFVTDTEGARRSLSAKDPMDLTGAAWSPDGKRVVYLSSNYSSYAFGPYAFELRVLDVARDRDRKLTQIDLCCGLPVGLAGQLAFAPTWSPVGRSVAFVSTSIVCATWGVCGTQTSLEVIDVDGKNRRTVAVDVNRWDEVAWSPDGSRIAYVALTGIKIARADGVGVAQHVGPVSKDAWGPTWSRQGRLAFVVGSPTDLVYPYDGEVWVADGTRARAVGGTTSQAPTWSPDGRTLAFADGGIKLIDADGTRSRTLTATSSLHTDNWPRWSPSGRSILFARQPDEWGEWATLRTVDVTTRRTKTLASTYLTSPTFSWAPR